jgi:hypothetical protein
VSPAIARLARRHNHTILLAIVDCRAPHESKPRTKFDEPLAGISPHATAPEV